MRGVKACRLRIEQAAVIGDGHSAVSGDAITFEAAQRRRPAAQLGRGRYLRLERTDAEQQWRRVRAGNTNPYTDTRALHLEIDELVRAVDGAGNELAGIEQQGEQAIEEAQQVSTDPKRSP